MKNISKILIIILAIFAAGNLLAMIAYADNNPDEDSQASSTASTLSIAPNNASIDIACSKFNYPWCGSNQPSGIGDLVGKFYKYALAIVGVAAFAAIIYGGILWSVSEAAGTKQQAKDYIMGAIYGLILLLSAYLILKTINPNLTTLTEPGIQPLNKSSSK